MAELAAHRFHLPRQQDRLPGQSQGLLPAQWDPSQAPWLDLDLSQDLLPAQWDPSQAPWLDLDLLPAQWDLSRDPWLDLDLLLAQWDLSRDQSDPPLGLLQVEFPQVN